VRQAIRAEGAGRIGNRDSRAEKVRGHQDREEDQKAKLDSALLINIDPVPIIAMPKRIRNVRSPPRGASHTPSRNSGATSSETAATIVSSRKGSR
jgi:hypothetical protein